MLFVPSKIAEFAMLPSNAVALLAAAGFVLLAAGWRRAGAWLAGAGVTALLVCGFSPVGNVLLLTLSERFPAWQQGAEPAPHGIIVLGGAINADASAARGDVELMSSGGRVLAMLELARRFPQARIVFSGGNPGLLRKGVPEAAIASRLLDAFGIDANRVTLEGASRTTDENARFSRDLLAPKPGERWLLVTSAFHMPRAMGAFRAAGFDVEAYPVDWRTRGWADAAQPFGKLSLGLARTDLAVHEWVGLAGYRLAGRTHALFPGP